MTDLLFSKASRRSWLKQGAALSLADGVTAYDDVEAATKRAAMASARRTILVGEAAKFVRTALAVVCPLRDFDVLVTDASPGDDRVETG